jgi:hypothetical protein
VVVDNGASSKERRQQKAFLLRQRYPGIDVWGMIFWFFLGDNKKKTGVLRSEIPKEDHQSV